MATSESRAQYLQSRLKIPIIKIFTYQKMAINTLYLDNGVAKSIRNIYNKNNPKNIQLENFFQKAVCSILQKKLYNSKFNLKFRPYKYKYFIAKSKEIDYFLKGRYFDDLIEKILGIKKYRISYEIRKFEPGNYTLLHDFDKEKSGIDFVIDFSKDGKNYGGYTVYLTETEELLQLNPAPNTLSFVERKENVMKYTKHFTHQNKNPIVQVVGTIFWK